MAHSKDKDQPPAYTSVDAPNHSTRASDLLQTTETGTYTSQYLENTFSIMVRCRGTFEPVVITINEDYDTLLKDFDYIFSQKFQFSESLRLKTMKVVWEKGWKQSYDSIGSNEIRREWYSEVNASNITAMLRLLKSQNSMNYIEIN